MEDGDQRTECFEPSHCLLLDRETRQLYICQRDQAILFFSLTEPGEKDAPWVFIDGLRMSPGNENYKVPPEPELPVELFARLDEYLNRIERC